MFDSDYHSILNQDEDVINEHSEVTIGDNCWGGARSMVHKGSCINDGAIIGANSMVMGEVKENHAYINKSEPRSVR